MKRTVAGEATDINGKHQHHDNWYDMTESLSCTPMHTCMHILTHACTHTHTHTHRTHTSVHCCLLPTWVYVHQTTDNSKEKRFTSMIHRPSNVTEEVSTAIAVRHVNMSQRLTSIVSYADSAAKDATEK